MNTYLSVTSMVSPMCCLIVGQGTTGRETVTVGGLTEAVYHANTFDSATAFPATATWWTTRPTGQHH